MHHQHAYARQTIRERILALLLAPVLIIGMAGLVAVSTDSAVHAAEGEGTDAGLTVSKDADTDVLVGDPITYTLTATNDTEADVYNLSFRDVLPAGVTYSSTEGNVGAPQIHAVKDGNGDETGEHVLIWSNVSDLPAGASKSLTFTAIPDADSHPVGATVENTAEAFANDSERDLTSFSGGDFAADEGTYDVSGESGVASTDITAIKIEKSEPSPEHELLRGVHDQTTVYTLKVTNNGHAATNDVIVVDYLPAGLEFLGCGGIDNGSVQEYGNRDLTGTPTISSDCPAPTSVETITASGIDGLTDGDVYTKVTWDVDDFVADQAKTINYAAGIPQRENVMFDESSAPTAESGEQAANLDNNTGPSTREQNSSDGTQDGEAGLTNVAVATGTYTGNVADGASASVSDDDSVTVTAEDLSIVKKVDTDTFEQGGIATYTLTVRASEYADASNVVVSDVIPDGLCPLKSGTTGTCATDGDTDLEASASVDSLSHNTTDGTWTVVFDAISVDHNEDATITYRALMDTTYDEGDNPPTVSGDTYTNTVSLVGTTTTRDDVDAPDSDYGDNGENAVLDAVRDASEATIGSGEPSLTKTIGKQVSSGTYACDSVDYTDNSTTDADSSDLTFRVGDRVCFTVRVDFDAGSSTKNAWVTDFLPKYVEYEEDSATATGDSDVTAAVDTDYLNDYGVLAWKVGGESASGDRFVDKGETFEWRFSAIVTKDPASPPTPDVTGNLAKLQWTDTDGTVGFLRDKVEFSAGATPPVSITKSHTGSDTVNGGDEVPYTITVTNDGTAENRNDEPMYNVAVRDILPDGIQCSNISDIELGGSSLTTGDVCTDDSPSVINTMYVGPLDAGDSVTLTYTMTIPDNPGVLTEYTNRTGVVTYDTETNTGVDKPHYPANDPGLTVPGETSDVPAAQADDSVTVADVSLTKTQTTGVDGTNNNADSEATIGETVTYTVTGTIPAHTTVYRGEITDTMPSGMEFESIESAEFNADVNGSGSWSSLPPSVIVAPAVGDIVILDLGDDPYVNDTDSDQAFRVTVTALVSNADSGSDYVVHGDSITNTATFVRGDTETGIGTLPDRTDSSTTTVVEPKPTITKADDATGDVAYGNEVTYTLTASNASGRPTLHDAVIVDCVPNGLEVVDASLDPDDGTPEAGDGTNGCDVGATKVSWTVDTLEAGNDQTFSYTVTVNEIPAGNQNFDNTVTIDGWSLPESGGSHSDHRSYTDNAKDTLTVVGADITKSTSTPTRTIGDTAEFTVEVTLPQQVNFYDATITDLLPSGIDADQVALTSSSCTPTGADCDFASGLGAPTPTGQNLTWSFGNIASADGERTVTLTYTAPVTATDATTPAAGDTLTNGATFNWNKVEGDNHTAASTDTATADVTVTEPDVSIGKTVSDDTPAPGDTFTYTVTASNGSGANVSTAHDVVVSDVVPSGVVVDTGTISDDGSYDAGTRTITWTVNSLAKGASADFTYDASLASPTSPGAQTNTATVDSYCSVATGAGSTCADEGGREYDGPNDTATVTPQLPHVSVEKTHAGGDLAYLGDSTEFTVTVTSDGDSAAYDVSATDLLPAGWTYDDDTAQVSIAGGTASQVEPDVSGQELTWESLNDGSPLAVGDTITIDYTATPGSGATPAADSDGHEPQTNRVSVSAEDAEGNTEDSTGNDYNGPDSDDTVYIDVADVTLAKAVGIAPVAGSAGSWTLTVANSGPDTAVGPFVVVDNSTPPTGITLTGASGDGWTCELIDAAHQSVDCERTDATDTLATGASFPDITVTYRVAANVTDGTTYNNTATVSGVKTYDPNTTPDDDNDSDDSTTSVSTIADLGITKTLDGALVAGADATLVAGADATYEIVVHNYGPSDSQADITVTDDIPDGTTFVSASGADWTCTTPSVGASSGTISCVYGTLVAGEDTSTLTVEVAVDADRTTAVTNEASVTATTPEDETGGDGTEENTDSVTQTPGGSADLAITKTHAASDTFTPGTDIHYTMTVENAGPSTAVKPSVSDVLPAELDFVSVDGGADWLCSYVDATRTVTCGAVSDFAPNASVSDITVVATIDSSLDEGVEIANKATVSSDTDDPEEDNNTSTDEGTTTDPSADLAITKSHTGSIVAGSDTALEYTLVVTNNGPSVLGGPITVTDTLPEGFSYVPGSATIDMVGLDPEPAIDSQTLTWTIGEETLTLGSGDSYTITYDVVVAADQTVGTYVNTATAESPTNDPDEDNNTSKNPTDVTAEADLVLAKSDPGTAPNAGAPINWQITVTNDGPSVSVGSDDNPITVTDTVPTWVSDATVTTLPDGWSVAGGPTFDAGETVTFEYASDQTLAVGASVEFVITGGVDSDIPASTTVTNTASVTPGETDDPDPDNNEETTDGTTPTIDTTLGVTKTRQVKVDGEWVDATSENPVVPGETVTYLVTVANTGGADARNVSISDTVEDYLAYDSFEPVTGDWSRTSSGSDAGDDQSFDLADNLVADQSAALRLTFDVDSGHDDVVENAVTASADNSTNEPEDDDNSDANRRADLTIAKSHTGEAVAGGAEPLEYTLVVTNNGPSVSGGPITVEDTLPAGFSYVRGSATFDSLGVDAEPEIDAQTLTWSIGDDTLALGPDDTYVITYKVVVASDQAAGTYVNGAEVDGRDDTDPSNNTATDEADVDTSADLQIVKAAADGPYVAGESVSYTLTVTNDGPSLARLVTVKDAVPAGMTLTDLTGDGWDCTVEAGLCAIAELPVGESTITATALIDDGVVADTALTNTATVDAATDDPNDGNNSDDETIDTSVVADLALDKQAVADDGESAIDTVTAGESAGYLFTVRNEGPSTAHGPVQVTDQLPAGMTFAGVGADSGAWDCSVDDADDPADGVADADADAQSITCELDGDVAAGESASALVVLVDVADDLAEGDLTNTASVSSSSPESNTDNNSDEATVSVEQHSDLAVTKRHDDDAVAIGQQLVFTLDAVNNGASVATGVTVTDEIPAGLDYVGAESDDSAWTVETTENDDGTTTLTAVLDGSLTVGEHAPALTVTTTVTADAYPSVANVATVDGDQTDDKPLNNIFADTVTVPPQSTLVLSKAAVGDFEAGSEAHYLITVTNEGPTEDPGPITVTDDLPDGMTYIDADSEQADCDADGQVVTCTVDEALEVDDSAEIALTVGLSPDAPSTISNSASVLSQTAQRSEAVLGATATASVAAASVSSADSGLPPTGSVLPIGIGLAAFVLLVGGLVLVLVARRRRKH